ncbi:NAD-dependent epimerase/dehydratase family protein [Actinoplanes sp. NPDC051513]|uniref:NAD-dependent epimerase/dehydratase family protein n=1 Tax=Actinoplanes sp. NPDC051513 TaxID=3363908 RepID=UPI003793A3CB
MKPSVAVLGASGVYARHLIPRLVARGHRVRALARRPDTATVAHACGADVRRADIFERDQLTTALRGCDVALNLATTLPGPSGPGDFAATDRLRREGTPIWAAACRDAGVERVLQQSIALVNSGAGDEWADEDTAFPPDDSTAGRAIAAALSMEDSIRQSRLDWCILRGGLFYGPGTGLDDDWFARAREGRLRLPGDGSDYASLVRIEDMTAATVLAIDRWPSRRSLIVADDQPSRWREIFGFIAAAVGAAPPPPGGRAGFPSWRVRNDRARDALGWQPFHATYRQGLIR